MNTTKIRSWWKKSDVENTEEYRFQFLCSNNKFPCVFDKWKIFLMNLKNLLSFEWVWKKLVRKLRNLLLLSSLSKKNNVRILKASKLPLEVQVEKALIQTLLFSYLNLMNGIYIHVWGELEEMSDWRLIFEKRSLFEKIEQDSIFARSSDCFLCC